MKHLAKLTMIAALAIMMMACGNGKPKVEDLEKAEASLYNEDMTANKEAFPKCTTCFASMSSKILMQKTQPIGFSRL